MTFTAVGTAAGEVLAEPPYPRPHYGWVLVVILLAAYAISFVDRQILSLLVEDLRADLAIGDAQFGLLQGPAFGLFYAIMGLPFGWLADRVNRMRLIAFGLLLWTVMTMLGGLANSFEWLLLTRIGVGVGEAALVPAAVSLLADSFAPQRRALPLAVFTAGVSVGAGLALILGGALVGVAQAGLGWIPLAGPWLDMQQPWQVVLILAGALGIPLALLIAMLAEPARRAPASTGTAANPAARTLFAWLAHHRRLFLPLLTGTSLLYLFSNAFSAWMPSLFVRAFGWTPQMVGLRLGLLILCGALAGNVLSGVIATLLQQRGKPHATLLTMTGGALLLAPLACVGPLLPGAALVQGAVALIYFAIALCFGVATASFVAVTPQQLRGQMVALYLLLGNLVGLGLGPPSVGMVIEYGLRDPASVGPALAIVAAATVLTGALLLRRALVPHRALAERIDTAG
ncbi:MFS transporter [Blastomonas fulva]|uniref:MFS transporter n=1 Tax=Blastomonas fulva TaxID=1550728 RepID=UPI003F726D17